MDHEQRASLQEILDNCKLSDVVGYVSGYLYHSSKEMEESVDRRLRLKLSGLMSKIKSVLKGSMDYEDI